MAASSIYGSQIQTSAQSLAAYLQALQAKQDGTNGTIANGNASGGDVAAAGTVVNGTGTATKGNGGKDASDPSSGQGLDVVTLSAEAQRLLANAQAPSVGPGSLATYLNTNNANNQVAGISSTSSTDPLGNGYEGAIAQFRQWLSRPLGQPVPYTGDATYDPNRQSNTNPNTSDQTSTSATQPVGSTST